MYGQHLALSLTAVFSEAEPQALSLSMNNGFSYIYIYCPNVWVSCGDIKSIRNIDLMKCYSTFQPNIGRTLRCDYTLPVEIFLDIVPQYGSYFFLPPESNGLLFKALKCNFLFKYIILLI
jgi:hypothetical protein